MEKRIIPNLRLAAVVILTALVLQGCGQNNDTRSGGESFAAVSDFNGTESNGDLEEASPQVSLATTSPSKAPTVEDEMVEGAAAAAADKSDDIQPSMEAASAPSAQPEEPAVHTEEPVVPPAKPALTEKPATPSEKAPMPTAKPIASPKPSVSTAPTASETVAATATAAAITKVVATSKPTAKPTTAAAPAATSSTAKPTAKPDLSGVTGIGWSNFFDGEDQTRPSERFWDLHGSEVTIKGFMGEVLSFEKNWFLLIPEPGAECPFDNGDETYWNKIMIVFVPEDLKLRYKSGPLQITGRLDVGIKIDDSGYKTMFRLYDASFKEIE